MDGKILLCLSGGGFRAVAFHLGVLKRLQELGVLQRVDCISSVSGGSILAATYCRMLLEESFCFDRFEERVIAGLKQNLFRRWFWRKALRAVRYASWSTIRSEEPTVVEALLEKSFRLDVKLRDLQRRPRLIINATDLNDGQAYYLEATSIGRGAEPLKNTSGRYLHQDMTLARAVAASAAYPIVMEPVVHEIEINNNQQQSMAINGINGVGLD